MSDDTTSDTTSDRTLILTGQRGIELRSMEDAYRFAQYVKASGMAPKGVTSPEQILVALQTGMEAGLTPMHSLRAVVVINGTPSWKGDTALALVRHSGKLKKWWSPSYQGEEYTDGWTCCVRSLRVDEAEPVHHCFSVKDAKRAGLWQTSGQSPWSKYPKRMLYYRALGFHLRDQYGDVLAGVSMEHEVNDYPVQAFATTQTEEAPTHSIDPLLATEADEQPKKLSDGPAADTDAITDDDVDEMFA